MAMPTMLVIVSVPVASYGDDDDVDASDSSVHVPVALMTISNNDDNDEDVNDSSCASGFDDDYDSD